MGEQMNGLSAMNIAIDLGLVTDNELALEK